MHSRLLSNTKSWQVAGKWSQLGLCVVALHCTDQSEPVLGTSDLLLNLLHSFIKKITTEAKGNKALWFTTQSGVFIKKKRCVHLYTLRVKLTVWILLSTFFLVSSVCSWAQSIKYINIIITGNQFCLIAQISIFYLFSNKWGKPSPTMHSTVNKWRYNTKLA